MVHIRAASRVAELLVEVLRDSDLSLKAQLRGQLVGAIQDGRLGPGDLLPPSRRLAHDLDVARGTVVEVYDQLVHEGFLVARTGAGTLVAPRAGLRVAAPERPGRRPPMYDLRPGGPDLSAFPRSSWASAAAHALRTMSDADLGYVHPWGTQVLRDELAPYLARTRHVEAGPEDVVVTSGATQALTLICRVLFARGHRSIAVEDPSNAIQRQVLSRYGLRIVNVPVDLDGIDVAALIATGARAVLVTPAHQYPSGVMLTRERRAMLVDWAQSTDAVIVEDDYDAEFQFRRLPMPSMQASAPHHVVHLASVSKTLAPATRLGWLVAPPGLRDDLRGAKRDDDFGTSAIAQHTLARLISSGSYDRHLRRQRMSYRMRRDALVASLARRLPSWTVRGEGGGLHLWLEPPRATGRLVDEASVVQAALDQDVLVLGMASMCRTVRLSGLVLGFARLTPRVADDAVQRLAHAVHLVDSGGFVHRPRPGPQLPDAQVAARLGTTGVDFFPAGLQVGSEPSLVPESQEL